MRRVAQLSRFLHLPREPADPADDIDLLAAAFVGLVERVVQNDAGPMPLEPPAPAQLADVAGPAIAGAVLYLPAT